MMKKLFTVDDFMIAFISALGYGFGESVSELFGWHWLACLAASLALGFAVEEIISKIAFSETVQKKTINRVLTYAAFFLVFMIADYVSVIWMGVSMIDYLLEEFLYVVGIPTIGFMAAMLIRRYRAEKIREVYGDGSKGYIFNMSKEDIEEINRQNQPVLGEYDTDCAVRTRTGIYVGEKDKNIISYLGIPYAKPPVGNLRWKAPEPLPSSEAVFEAKNYGASAVQVDQKGLILKYHRQSEDCLTLNIIVSDDESENLKPVLVVFHQGIFSYGGSVDPLLEGCEFVDSHSDIVFVSFNYRLGIFGFVDFSEVPGGDAYPDSANLGLLDQIAALQWVKENIAAFGGDPERITVLGFEAGATSICLLSACERAKGLFSKAFIFGSPVLAYDNPKPAKVLASKLLKETNTSTMDELLQLKTESLKEAAQRLWSNMYGPTCDGKLLPSDVYRACKNGAASGIEFIIGFTSNEMQVFHSFLGDKNYGDLISVAVADMMKYLDDSAANAVHEYIETQTALSTELEAKSKLIEQWNALCIHRIAFRLLQGGNKVHLMYWDEKPLIEKLGSGTVDTAATLLGNDEALRMYGSMVNADLSETLQSFLLKFMNGNPLRLYTNEIKGVSAIEWKSFPKALIVSDDKIHCDTITNRLTEIKGLLDYTMK